MNKTKLIIIIGITILIAASLLFVLQRVDRMLDLQALHDCASDYRQEIVVSDKITKIRPLEQQVQECAWQKGVRPAWTGIWSDLPK